MKLVLLAFFPLLCMLTKHVVQEDGPYVYYKDDKIYVNYIVNDHGNLAVKTDSVTQADKQTLVLRVNTDEPGKQFNVKLKDKIETGKIEVKDAKKQFVISDIEGNFGAFRKLLQAGGVIDKDFNWTFGNGHLVLIGDFVDRGAQVTEVLWLIYSLEDKAKAAGGEVHYILGNHEVMIMGYDTRYVNAKYRETEARLGNYSALFNDNSELGRWLRSKNIMEKIGKGLYLHAGVSAEVNALSLSLKDINNMIRPYYSDSSNSFPNSNLITMFDSRTSPFWYRGYYVGEPKASAEQVNKTLELYDAKYIVTGHSIVDDKITRWYDGKVFNTDLKHAEGISEGLLIDDNEFYRVSLDGNKVKF